MDALLPPGWEKHTSSKTGQVYFYHVPSGQSQYEAPPEPDLLPGWTKHMSAKTGKCYFYHSATGESRYEPPYAGASSAAPLPGSATGAAAASVAHAPAPALAAPSYVPPARPAADAATALKVASAYDSLADRGRAGRQGSTILHLKNFNNWVKAVLISSSTPRPCGRVLDLACGKLGDFQKWRLAGVHTYCAMDISRQGMEDAVSRFNDGASAVPGLQAKFVRADLGAVDLTASGVLEPSEQFDAISIQFALHYLFQTEQRALTFFRNIANRLAPGGVFLGTIPDAAVLIRRLRDLQPGGPPPTPAALTQEQLKFGNEHYSVEFDAASACASWRLGGHPFGVRYTFYLSESVERVDEYLVPWELLDRLARAVGLEPIAADNFHDFFARMTGAGVAPGQHPPPVGEGVRSAPENLALLSRMGVLDVEGTLSLQEWEVIGLYRVFAFRAPMTGAKVDPALPVMDVMHPEWAGRPALPLRCRYTRTPTVGGIVDLVAEAGV